MDQAKSMKITLIGHGYTGKTSLLKQFTEGEFDERYVATTEGGDFKSWAVERGGELYDLNLWTVSGQACRYPGSVPPITFRGSNAIVLVFAIVDEQSMTVLEEWRNKALEIVHPETPFVLVANKCDKKRMSERDISQLAEQSGYDLWFQTSAKTGENVSRLFEETADLVISKTANLTSKNSILNLRPPRPKKKKCKCG
ncbi:ras-related protein Rab-13-like [Convolutriloba macropyga]|uniref:ras-related protein Rab-13-like n=1 Tax=Convolutriloba macropyga TaxID=536237 RepID=UPI003F528A91